MISVQLRYFLVFVRGDIKKRTQQDDYREMPTSPLARTRLIIEIRKAFPKTEKDRDLRLNLIMAMTGMPITSQNDLPATYTSALIGALHDNLALDTTGKLSRELEELVENPSNIFPWKVLDPGHACPSVPNLRYEDDKYDAIRYARSDNFSRPGTEESVFMVS